MELSVIVPCLNEEANVPELVSRLGDVFKVGGIDGELILVDDGSSDGTWAAIESSTRENPFVVGRRHAENRGIAAGWKTGVAAARGRLVCILDADLQYQPEDILRLRREMEVSNVDIVQGWRSPIGRDKGPRYYYSRGLNAMLNTAFGMDLKDNKSGFILCAREVMEDLLSYRGRYYYWQSFIMVAAHKKGYTYKQIETLFENRRAGKSFLDNAQMKAVARSFVDIGKALFEYRFRPQSPSTLRTFLDRERPLVRDAPEPAWRRLYWNGYLSLFGATHWLITKEVGRQLEDLKESQWLSQDKMRELQLGKLRKLVLHAYRHVPFYRDRMRELGIVPDDIRSLDDLSKLPFLTKDDVRKHLYFSIMSDNHDKAEVLKVTTSGSTGEPFVCFVDRAQLEFRWAATLRSMEWTGWRFGDRQLRLWHQTLGMSKTQVVREFADALLSRRKFIPAYEMSDETLRQFVAAIEEFGPVLLDGYAESFNFLAKYLQEHGKLKIRPKGIISSAQTLPEGSRKLIEESFGCKVFDKYGSREFSGIAYECEAHVGHHVVGEGYIVEVLKDGRPAAPGEIGEVVVTDLNNYCLPFIRYRIGDLAEALDPNETCPCGRGLPRLGKIEGRVQSIIIGSKGQYIPGTFFAHLFKDYDHAIRQFQIVQTDRGAITLKVVKGKRYSDDTLQEVLRVLHQFLGDDMNIAVDFVENIDMVRTGKRLATVSKLGIDFQNRDKAS
ncbi:MAG TPA: glycosyltransferase [Polyangia bacterium]|nr:glycosyltransferase [Polyangia bacterium]